MICVAGNALSLYIVIPNPDTPFVDGVRDLLFFWGVRRGSCVPDASARRCSAGWPMLAF